MDDLTNLPYLFIQSSWKLGIAYLEEFKKFIDDVVAIIPDQDMMGIELCESASDEVKRQYAAYQVLLPEHAKRLMFLITHYSNVESIKELKERYLSQPDSGITTEEFKLAETAQILFNIIKNYLPEGDIISLFDIIKDFLPREFSDCPSIKQRSNLTKQGLVSQSFYYKSFKIDHISTCVDGITTMVKKIEEPILKSDYD